MSEQQKGSEVSGVASDSGMTQATSHAVELKTGSAAVEVDKPKRRSAAKAKVALEGEAEPAKPKRTRSAKAKNLLVNEVSSSGGQVEAGQEQSSLPRPESPDLPSLPPAPVPTPEGIAFMQQHLAYQGALDERTKLERARLEKAARGSKASSLRTKQQTVEARKQPDSPKDQESGGRDDVAAVGPTVVQSVSTRQRKAKENSIEAGRDIRKAAISEADLQAIKDHDDVRILRQLLDRSRAIAAPGESTATKPSAVDAVQLDVGALRAIKDPIARKLGISVVEQNRQADAGYRGEFDKLAPEFIQVVKQANAGTSAAARSSAPIETSDGKAPVMSTAVPESVRKRFLKVDSDYFFPDRSPAFVDRGAKLATRGEHPEVVRALVEIAKERGWDSVTVKGSEAFRRAAWMEAARNGMQIAGYKPTELDLAQLKQREPNNSIEPGLVRDQGATRPEPLSKSAEEQQKVRTLDEKLSAFANDRPTLVVKKYPELVQAYALLDVARKFAEVHMPGHEDRFVAVGRELITQQIREGSKVVGPRIHPDQIGQSRSGQQKSVAVTVKGVEEKAIVRER
jgi:hypothetical protein